MKSREIRLASRPHGWPVAENFEHATVDVPEPGEGQVQVKNLFVSVDPYMRGRMNDVPSYVPPFKVGAALDGGAVGTVTSSRAPGFSVGDVVLSMNGWREAFVAETKGLTKLDASVEPLSSYLGVLGTTGFTAWVGLHLHDIAPADVVFVSAAAGATGSVVGQLAKIRGCRVVGSAGSDDKVRFLKEELGFDAAFNYKNGDLAGQLKAAAPQGIDVYFDNVGGDHLEAAIGAMRLRGRITCCGAVSRYNDARPSPGPSNLSMIVGKRLTVKGFIVSDHMAELPTYVREATEYLKDGRLKARETIVSGIDKAPSAFIDLLRGDNVGKMIVKVS